MSKGLLFSAAPSHLKIKYFASTERLGQALDEQNHFAIQTHAGRTYANHILVQWFPFPFLIAGHSSGRASQPLS